MKYNVSVILSTNKSLEFFGVDEATFTGANDSILRVCKEHEYCYLIPRENVFLVEARAAEEEE